MATLETPNTRPAEEASGFDPFETPVLLEQLQDDLARSRKREALWMSLFFHALILVTVVLSPKWTAWLPAHKSVVVSTPQDLMRQQELTYLNLPPDEQKLTQRPKTNIISDKDRIATSRAPRINRDELKKIVDSARPGAPGEPGARVPPSAPAQAAQSSPGQRQQTNQETNGQGPSYPQAGQIARAKPQPNPFAAAAGMSAGTAIQQAARAAAASRGGYGAGGDYGLATSGNSKIRSDVDILSDTMGVDFGPYLSRILHDIRTNWYSILPQSVYPPLLKKGKLTIEFAIMKDGSVAGMRLASPSGDVALDRAAWGGISGSSPFPPLPGQFRGNYIALRIRFGYNIEEKDLQ